jgi:hypothetical protein
MPMTDDEFGVFLTAANLELRHKQDALKQQYRMGSYSRWWFEQATAKLQFFDESGRLALEADVIEIGSYASKSNTWTWAWGNSSVDPSLRQKAQKLEELEAVTGIKLFSQEHAFTVEGESMAWELAAISVKHLGAMGCYRAPSSSGGPATFLAILSAAFVRPNSPSQGGNADGPAPGGPAA